MDSPAVKVIVVNWNGDPFLSGCLASLQNQDYPNYTVCLVDNASTDGSYESAVRDFPDFEAIQLDSNRGFGAAANAGFRHGSADYFALLNPDAEAEPGWLTALVAEAEREPGAGMTAGMVIGEKGSAFDSAGLAVSRDGFVVHRTLDDEAPLLGPAGAAALYSAALIERTDGFYEDYFLYYEDADLAFRAARHGFGARLAPDACVRHVHSGVTGRNPAQKRRLLHRNRLIFLLRCWPGELLVRKLPLLLIGEAVSLLGRIFRLRIFAFGLAIVDVVAVTARIGRYRAEENALPGNDIASALLSKRMAVFEIARRQRGARR